MADEKNDNAGQVVWEPGRAAPTSGAPTPSPVEAAAWLAQQLATGNVKGVHITLFLREGDAMARAMFGYVTFMQLVWMAAHVEKDALAMNTGEVPLPPGAAKIDPATGKPKGG